MMISQKLKSSVRWIAFFVMAIIFLRSPVLAQPHSINLSNSFAWDGEPYVAVNPASPQNIVIAWMSFQPPLRIGIEVKASLNGGQTWSTSTFMQHFGTTFTSADVSLAFSKSGIVYIAYIDYHQNPDSGGVFVCHSNDGGINWSAPVQAIDITEDPPKVPLDRPWLVIDNSNTSSQGNLYLTSKPAPWIAPPNRPYYKVSTDSGTTWSAFHFADTVGFNSNIIQAPMASPAVGADGTFYMVYPAIVGLIPSFVFALSDDHGNTLHRSVISTAILSADTNPKQAWHLSADPADSSKLAFVWTDNRNGDLDIYVSSSQDRGQTWSLPARINDDVLNNGTMQDMVWSAFGNDGKLIVAWRDRRNAADTGFYQPFDIYAAVSMDGGINFSDNFKLNDFTSAFDSSLSLSGNDFLGIDMQNDSLHLAWSDYRNGQLEVYYTTAPVSSLLTVAGLSRNPPLRVYPVPASDRLNIEFNGIGVDLNSLIQFRIIASTGQESFHGTFQFTTPQNELDIQRLPNGNYWLILEASKREYRAAFSVSH